MPGFIRKVAIVAAVDGLIIQPSHQTQRSIHIDYHSQKITTLRQATTAANDKPTIDSYGIVGLMKVPPNAYLLAITGRKQVARIFGAPIYTITDVALIPLSSQVEAEKAIVHAKASLKSQLESPYDESDGDAVEDADEEDRHTPSDNASVVTDNASPTESSPTKRGFTNIAQDVIGNRGQYGRFTERWFSRKGWVTERRMSQGMSKDIDSDASPRVGNTSTSDSSAATGPSIQNDDSNTGAQGPVQDGSESVNGLALLPKLLRTTKLLLSSNNFFFSYDIDISRRFGYPNKFSGRETPLSISFDPLFYWNRYLINPFLAAGCDSFSLPIMQGFVGQRSFTLSSTSNDAAKAIAEPSDASEDEDEQFLVTLISRRSIKRPGLRYLRRGIDDGGHTANTVETEQILSRKSWDRSHKIHSFVQIRGSIPLFFSQSPYSFKPTPVLQQSDENNLSAFRLHFKQLFDRYGPTQIVLLTDKNGPEAAIGQKYQSLVDHANDEGGIESEKLDFEWFDFHAECSGMRFDNIKLLLQRLGAKMGQVGATVSLNEDNESQQHGVIRTNCMDCLDRTNVVQAGFAQRSLEGALRNEGFKVDFHADKSTQWFNSLWADNGDAISKQYSSTAALKGDFTRTRKRNYKGALNDLSLTLYRYYNNIVNDYFAQTTIDYLLGNANAQVFEDFEENLMSRDPGMSIKKIRENAISTSVKIVIADSQEDLVGAWTLLSPQEPNSIRILPLEESVVLLTDTALYKVWFDWSIEKVSSFERIDLHNINTIMKGTYVTSTLTAAQANEDTNVGFVIGYRAGDANISRINTRSLSSAPGLVDEASSPLRPAEGSGGKGPETSPIGEKAGENKVMAFKALPSRSSVMGNGDDSDTLSERQVIGDICGEIVRVTKTSTGNRAPVLVRDGEIVSLSDAKKSTGLVEQWAHSLKRMIVQSSEDSALAPGAWEQDRSPCAPLEAEDRAQPEPSRDPLSKKEGVNNRQNSESDKGSMKPDGLEIETAEAQKPPPTAAFHVIFLGSGGGPLEDNVTGLLVRSTATNWAKGSVLAVDAGIHLAAVTNIIQQHLPKATSRRPSQPQSGLGQGSTVFSPPVDGTSTPSKDASDQPVNPGPPQDENSKPQLVLSSGPLANFELPHATPKANAAYFVRNLITTYLITHPHLDHISGFVINTAGFQHTSRPKRLAGLPSTIDAFKTHIFNDTIWPNLSDEDGGVGLVSYMRLAEGGNLAIGEGEARGYIEVCDGIAVKGWGVSHGKCMHNHGKRGSGSGHGLEQFNESVSRRASASATTPNSLQHGRDHFPVEPCVIDSSAFFLRDDHSGHEILIFGDVEPDSLSLSPRTHQVWTDAAAKVSSGMLKAVLIESSYDESQSDETLFGHLAPRHVIAELQVLATKLLAHRESNREGTPLKRKRASNGTSIGDDIPVHVRKPRATKQPRRKGRETNASPGSLKSENSGGGQTPRQSEGSTIDVPAAVQEMPVAADGFVDGPLNGLQVVIIHVKDNLKDEPDAGETILAELQERENEARLGCTFRISQSGTSLWL